MVTIISIKAGLKTDFYTRCLHLHKDYLIWPLSLSNPLFSTFIHFHSGGLPGSVSDHHRMVLNAETQNLNAGLPRLPFSGSIINTI